VERDYDPDGTPEGVFGGELRFYREQAGMTQEQLAARVNVSHDVISKIETGYRPPARDFPERLDAVPELDTRQALTRLWKRLSKAARHRAYPGWFAPWPDMEAQATALQSYEPLLVPGLLQTEGYARAILRGAQADATDDEIDQQVAARLERQAILSGANPPHLWVVIDEGVLHRRIGDAKTMLDQLWHVVRAAERPKVSVQVVPFDAGERTGLLGAFTIAGLDGGGNRLYLETATTGQLAEAPSAVSEAGLIFDTLRSEALPRVASRDLIVKVAEGKWTT
jgi:transcriptional regulator with XRE-family HTH domain